MKPLWLQYLPGGLIQIRQNLRRAYEIWVPELELEVGRVELYTSEKHGWRERWRTLDNWKCDFRDGYATREQAAQELVTQSPRVKALIEGRRARVASGQYKLAGQREVEHGEQSARLPEGRGEGVGRDPQRDPRPQQSGAAGGETHGDSAPQQGPQMDSDG